MFTLLRILISPVEMDKEAAPGLFVLDLILSCVICFLIGYYGPLWLVIGATIKLSVLCALAKPYHKYRKKIRESLLPPEGSPPRAYLDFEIKFDRAMPWKRLGDAFFEYFNHQTLVIYAFFLIAGIALAKVHF